MTTKGLCQCGCGNFTKLAPRNQAGKGWVKGEPMRYIAGHNMRGVVREKKSPVLVQDTLPRAVVENFVLYLGVNRQASPESVVHRRDPREYKRLLQLCIDVYGRRKDKVGELHVLYAKRELSLLK